ncbi:STT3 subunit of oligosaccharyl transferase [Helicosporidium sp. ATCC 50920]|nr:STT3 subunit of oligosaccharyl transferase [Helicosporidium sp. ATCC 50920]|eukprot:KDD76460.1 STT3 subunit of oligosaccharyl transferase [Helicosporidium sp. ATCC 50920]
MESVGVVKARREAYASLMCGFALLCICLLATAVRLFSVIKFESVIHEFDPYFNYRVTRFLTDKGFYATWNLFDSFTWYPLGRIVGGTMYPGLIFTAGAIWKVLHFIGIPLDILNVCMFMGPLFSSIAALSTYGLMSLVRGRGAGLAAAFFVAVVPSYISRSVAGSYDLECIAIAALITTFYLYVRTLRTGSLGSAVCLFLAYLYMVSSWGGYSFIANLIPLHALACIVSGRADVKLYVAYAPWAMLGALAALNIPVIGFNAVRTSEHFASFGVWALLNAVLGVKWVRSALSPRSAAAAQRVVVAAALVGGSATLLTVVAYVMASPTFGWSGRSLSLLDPTYASKYIPIIASVSEHQPPTWANYYMDLHLVALLAPAGLLGAFAPLSEASLFLVMYAVTAVYFSGVMVRLMLVLAPAACCLAGLAASELLCVLFASVHADQEKRPDLRTDASERQALQQPSGGGSQDLAKGGAGGPEPKAGKEAAKQAKPHSSNPSSSRSSSARSSTSPRPGGLALGGDVTLIALGALLCGLLLYLRHGIYVAGELYSSPSVVIQTKREGGGPRIIDDFREAYSWLSHNTPEDAKVASWWDYGYQTTAMANRTVIVDNNTWNNTHIATVGRAMASPERKAAAIFRTLDVEYVFVVFGAFIGYPSDDINKFLWMVRIGGGVFPEIKEKDFLSASGSYRVDDQAGRALTDSIVYRLSYYRFAEAAELLGLERGYDRVRQAVIGLQDFELKHFEEVFTSEHWMVRIYRVLPEPNREAKLRNPHRVRLGKGD